MPLTFLELSRDIRREISHFTRHARATRQASRTAIDTVPYHHLRRELTRDDF